MKKVLVISMLAVAAASQAFVFSTTTGGGAIADGTGTNGAGATRTLTLVVSGTGQTITSLSAVRLIEISHSWIGDMSITLKKGSLAIDLMDRNYRTTTTGFGLSNDFVTTNSYSFTESGPVIPSASAVVASGSFARHANVGANGMTSAANSYGDLVGQSLDGTWTLEVIDYAGGDTGAIAGFEIRGEAVPEPATMAALGLGALAVIRRRRSK